MDDAWCALMIQGHEDFDDRLELGVLVRSGSRLQMKRLNLQSMP